MRSAGLSLFVLCVLAMASATHALHMEIFHKFSAKAVDAMRSRHGVDYAQDWPRQGTIAFQTMLRDHDVARHTHTARRMLAATSRDQYVFSTGNATEQLFGGGWVCLLDLSVGIMSPIHLQQLPSMHCPQSLHSSCAHAGCVKFFARSARLGS